MTGEQADEVLVLALDDAEGAVNRLARLRARIKKAEARCAERIAAAMEAARAETEEDRAVALVYEQGLEKWAARHRAEWGKAKSLKLAGGTIGFRKDPPALKTVGKGGWAAAVERVKRVLGEAFIRSKPEVDRDAVKAAGFDEAKLRTAGLKLAEGKEQFYVETQEVEF